MRTRLAMVVLLVLTLTACLKQPGGAGASGGAATGKIAIVPDDPSDDPNDFGRPGDPAGYSHSKAMAKTCACMADLAEKSLATALSDARGLGVGRPAVDLSSMQFLSCANATVPGAMPTMPSPPTLPRTGKARRAGEIAVKAKAAGLDVSVGADGAMTVTPATSGTVDATALRDVTASVSSALRLANLAEQQCNAMALQRGTSLVINVSTRDVNSGLADLPGYVAKERTRLHRVLAAAKRADAIAASTSALAAALRKAVQTGTAKTVDATADALAAALPVPAMTASDEELDALMAAADHDASVILENAHEWSRAQVAAGHGMAGPGPGAGGASAAGGGPVMSEGDSSDASAIAGAFMGLFRGDLGAIVRGAAVLFPKDSAIRNGMAATGALLQGDVVGAVRAAAKMVPPESSIGQALATAQSVIDTAHSIAGAAKAL